MKHQIPLYSMVEVVDLNEKFYQINNRHIAAVPFGYLDNLPKHF